MTTQSDQIEEILKAEQKANKHLELTQQKITEEEFQLKTKMGNDIEEKKKMLLERKKQKLEITEQEAAHIINTKKAESEGGRNSLISNAQSKQGEAVDLIITRFVEHIKE